MNIENLKIKDVLLKPSNALLKVLGIPFLGFIGITLFIFLKGFSEHRYISKTPPVIELGFSISSILLLMLCFFTIIYLILKLFSNTNYDEFSEIQLLNKTLRIETANYIMTIKISNADLLKISISSFWGIFLKKYYKIGKVKIKYKGDSYSFLFPIRDMELEQQIKDLQ